MTKEAKSRAYAEFMEKYLSSNPDALLFVLGYVTYCHMIDDVVDNEIPADECRNQLLLKILRLAPVIYSSPFYMYNINKLYSLVILAHDTYVESLNFVTSNDEWKRALGDMLRHNANEVILACVEIVGGYESKVGAAAVLRELSYYTHHDEKGNPC